MNVVRQSGTTHLARSRCRYWAIRSLHQRGEKVDAVTVAAAIGADGVARSYCACANYVPSAAAVCGYAGVLNARRVLQV